MNYYCDESGSTGDLVTKKFDMGYFSQPIFTHTFLGLDDENESVLNELIPLLKENYGIESEELKSKELYFSKPEFILDLLTHINSLKIPIISEVMHKKFIVAININDHYILNESGADEFTAQSLRTMKLNIANHLTYDLPDSFYLAFFNICKNPSETLIINFFDSMLEYFKCDEMSLNYLIHHIMSYRKEEFFEYCSEYGIKQTVKWFYPIPDFDSSDNILSMLPNVFSFYYLLARINKQHDGDLSNVKIIHDTQNEFSATLMNCFNPLSQNDANNYAYDKLADYDVTKPPSLIFVDSKDSIGVQVADLISGFLNRFTNGFLYKNVKIDEIYFHIMNLILSENRNNHNSYGVNFVIPLQDQQKIFMKFSLYL